MYARTSGVRNLYRDAVEKSCAAVDEVVQSRDARIISPMPELGLESQTCHGFRAGQRRLLWSGTASRRR